MNFILNILTVIFLCIINIYNIYGENYSFINLPESHLPYYFRNFPNIAKECEHDVNCEYQKFLLKNNNYNKASCWGYEYDCKKENSFTVTNCPGDHNGWVKNKETQINTFYIQTDFGYIKQQINEMMLMCEPFFPHDSSLECSKYLRFCRGRNILLNLTDLSTRQDPIRYKLDVLKQGQIGGYCTPHYERLYEELSHLSALQSWAPELRYFEHLPTRPIESNKCDLVIEKPTYIMKIDATVNMYHHFCDFFNLYASLHVNLSHPTSFSNDINILIWETYDYDSPFKDTFKAFTKNPILDLKTFRGEVVCFKNLILPLLPRMIFGLYYNTPIINGCEGSGLFQSFSEFILHRLNIPLYESVTPKIRITILSRKTKYRQILNENELIDELKKNSSYEVRQVTYERTTKFTKQLEITRNTDILIGMHGAGLTHLLFLPNWATIFEIYNCGDPTCYYDLARLRGINYITWEDNSKLIQQVKQIQKDGDDKPDDIHAKFTNYSFDRTEFVTLVNRAASHVWNNEEYKKFIELSTPTSADEVKHLHNEL